MMKKLLLSLMMVSTVAASTSAQCAMCRATLENNFSNGDPGIASSINVGILYLLVLPYLAVAVLGFLWYRSSKNGS